MSKALKDFSAEDLFDGTDFAVANAEGPELRSRFVHDGSLPDETREGFHGAENSRSQSEWAAMSRAISMAQEAGEIEAAELLFDTLASMRTGRVATPDEIVLMGMLFSATDSGSAGLLDKLWESYPEHGTTFAALLFSARVN